MTEAGRKWLRTQEAPAIPTQTWTPSTVHHYRVFAINASGQSESSERAWAATRRYAKP